MLDCVILVPIDEAWFVVPPSLIGATVAATDDYEFGVLPNDDYTPLLHLDGVGSELEYAIVPSVSPSFGLRPGSNLLVYATECAVATGDVTLAVSYYPRWVTLRGAE